MGLPKQSYMPIIFWKNWVAILLDKFFLQKLQRSECTLFPGRNYQSEDRGIHGQQLTVEVPDHQDEPLPTLQGGLPNVHWCGYGIFCWTTGTGIILLEMDPLLFSWGWWVPLGCNHTTSTILKSALTGKGRAMIVIAVLVDDQNGGTVALSLSTVVEQ